MFSNYLIYSWEFYLIVFLFFIINNRPYIIVVINPPTIIAKKNKPIVIPKPYCGKLMPQYI